MNLIELNEKLKAHPFWIEVATADQTGHEMVRAQLTRVERNEEGRYTLTTAPIANSELPTEFTQTDPGNSSLWIESIEDPFGNGTRCFNSMGNWYKIKGIELDHIE